MRKRKNFIMAGALLACLLLGCGQKQAQQEQTPCQEEQPDDGVRTVSTNSVNFISEKDEQTPPENQENKKENEQTPLKKQESRGENEPTPAGEQESKKENDLISPENQEKETDTTPSAPRWAQDKMELSPGMEVEGVFDASRKIIRLSLQPDGDMIKLFVDGEEKLSVPENCEFRLRDILKEDACMELLVGSPASIVNGYNGEQMEGFMVTAYRIHPGELAAVPLLPSGEDNSFFVEEGDWEENGIRNWYFGAGFFAYTYNSAEEKWKQYSYRMMPEGYLLAKRDSLAVIYVDGEPLVLREEKVKIDRNTGVGIAFEETGAAAGTTYYNVYRTEDSGQTWSLVTEDFYAASASMEYIYILDENTILCRFCPDGPWIGNSAYATLDGGKSWEHIGNLEEMKKYDFLQGEHAED